MSIVFADVAGFGSMSEPEVKRFSSTVLPACTQLADTHKTAFCNTWGDAIVAFFDSVEQAIAFALELRDMFRSPRDESSHLGHFRNSLSIRISVHSADVYVSESSATAGGKIFFGTQVSVAARVEPITAPNEVFATEAVVAMLKGNPGSIAWTDLGKVTLPKEQRREKLYWIRRKGERKRRIATLIKPPALKMVDSDERVFDQIRSGPRIKKMKILALNGGSSMHYLLALAESHLAAGASVSIVVYDPDCTQLSPPALVDGSMEEYLVKLRGELPASTQSAAACEYLMQASEITAWSNDSQSAQISRLKERLSSCVHEADKKNITVRLAKSPRWVPARCWLVDDRVYVTNYWQPKKLSPIIAAERRHPFFEAVESHFEYIWSEVEQMSGAQLFEATSKGKNTRK